MIGPSNAQGIQVLKEGLLERLRKLRERDAGLAAAADRLVIDVSQIHHAFDLVAAKLEVALEQILENIGAEVSDMREIIDRRTARVHPHPVGIDGLELFDFARERIEESQAHFRSTAATAMRGDSFPAARGIPGLRSSSL